MSKPTIFISITQGIVARNLLFNDFFIKLKEKYKVVIFSQLSDDDDFRKAADGAEVFPLENRNYGKFKRKIQLIIHSLNRSLIYNPTVEIYTKTGFFLTNKKERNTKIMLFIRKNIFGRFLAKYKWPRKFVHFLDNLLFRTGYYDSYIDKYNPELVFVTSIMDLQEIEFLRNAKKKKVKTAAMARSWDNLSKTGFREMADYFFVWSEYMFEEALNFQMYREEQIKIIGVPQFDYYQNRDLPARDDFFRKYKLDPAKKLIFFGSVGPYSLTDAYVVKIIKKAILSGELGNYQILIRPHFMFPEDSDKFKEVVDDKVVFIDTCHRDSGFRDVVELSLDTVINLACQLKYNDVMVTGPTTLFLDAASVGRLAILYNFDEDKNKKFSESTKRFYQSLWFKEILNVGIDNVALDEADLLRRIKNQAEFEAQSAEKRAELVRRFCFRADGKSGERLFAGMVDIIDKKC